MPDTSSDPFNPIPSNANDEMNKLRESIPAKDRCSICDGFGMIMDRFLRTYRVCQQCGGSGRNNRQKNDPRM
jgi:DnaJ-class molecular chaperone